MFLEGTEAWMENVKITVLSCFPNVSDLRIFQTAQNILNICTIKSLGISLTGYSVFSMYKVGFSISVEYNIPRVSLFPLDSKRADIQIPEIF